MGYDGMCGRCRGVMKLIFGILILINIFLWPKWTATVTDWLAFFGVLLVIFGILKIIKPTCGCEASCCEMPAAGAKKKK